MAKIGKELKEMPPDSVIRLDNTTCPYCGTALTIETSSKEHVIGRRFVPKGKLHGIWNLIVNACKPCNGIKSDLEDDISAITLQPDVFGKHGHNDATAKFEAKRKAQKAYSRRTKKPVKDSQEQIKLDMPFTGGNFSFSFTSPAQIEPQRVYDLARLQLMGFFYWITFNEETKRGGFWQGSCCPILEVRRGDWGNTIHRAFMDAVAEWEPRVLAINADGFYKVIIRRHPNAECWSWAVEWNHDLRVIGFFGDVEAAQAIASSFPKMEIQTIHEAPGQFLRFHTEVPLKKGDDTLFIGVTQKKSAPIKTLDSRQQN